MCYLLIKGMPEPPQGPGRRASEGAVTSAD
jgi:hypothetical protein